LDKSLTIKKSTLDLAQLKAIKSRYIISSFNYFCIIIISIPIILFSQESNGNKKNEIIIYEYITERNFRIKRLLFSSSTMQLNYREAAAVSQNGKIAAVFKYASLYDSNSIVTIFNVLGDKLNSFKVAPIGGYILLMNNENFVIFGSPPHEGIGKPIFVKFYTKDGVEIIPDKNEFGLHVYPVISEKKDILLIAGIEEKWPSEFMHANITIYDKSFTKIGEYKIDDLSGHSQFKTPLIDSTRNVIKVLISSGMGENYKVDTTFINFKGRILKKY